MKFVPRLLGPHIQKAARAFPAFILARPLARLAQSAGRYQVSGFVVRRTGKASPDSAALREGVRAIALEQLGEALTPTGGGRAKRRTRPR